MKRLIHTIAIVFVILLLIYLFINICVLYWDIFDPTGFWGLFWFYSICSVSFSIYIVLLSLILSAFVKGSYKEFGIKGLIVLFAFFIIGSFFEYAPTLFFAKKLYDKYRYVNLTEEYINEGEYEKALDFADRIYKRSVRNNFNKKTSVWVLKNIYLKSKNGIILTQTRQYQALFNYAFCNESLNKNLKLSEKLYFQCEKLATKYFNHQIDYSLAPLIRRTRIYLINSDINSAERNYDQFLKQFQSLEGKDFDNMVSIMMIYANFSQQHGDNEKAQNIREKILELYEQSSELTTSSIYLNILLSVINGKINNHELKAIVPLILKASKIASKKRNQEIYLDYLNVLAFYKEFDGHPIEAEDILLKTLKLSKKKNELIYLDQLTSLANFYYRQKNYSESLKSFSDALKLTSGFENKKIWTADHLVGLGLSNFALGKLSHLKSLFFEIDSTLKTITNQYFLFLTIQEKEKFVNDLENKLRISNSVYINLKDSILIGKVYDNVLSTKSIALLSNKYLENYLDLIENINLSNEYKKIKKIKSHFENQRILQENSYFEGQGDSIYSIERSFLKKISENKNFKPFKITTLTWVDVKRSLEKNEVAVEFINSPNDPLNLSRDFYYALVIKKEFQYPQLVPLCSEKELMGIINILGSRTSINLTYTDSVLYDKLWDPIKKYTKGVNNVYISLSGMLNQISFSALTLAEPYRIKIVSSTSNLVSLKNNISNINKKCILFGDIDYNNSLKTNTLVQQSYNPDLSRTITKIKSEKFSYLPGTKEEIKQISKILNSNNIEFALYTGKSASENAFRKIIDQKPDIIHLATHGFYYPEENSMVFSEKFFGYTRNTTIQNPMNRSGLLFSGASSNKLQNFENDGVLTSNEISGMDLSGIKLVVLSACETGLGDIRGNEGVFGLQRAFIIAGVESLIVSLWKVPDIQTSELMLNFYKNYTKGLSKSEALKLAQIQCKNKYNEPYYWAAFYVIEK